ncbi:beta-ketoacyl synthase N-terminal-like domain-containing protein [Hyalangium minutum]|uniref:Malonyl CoA-acyl carrier protein transacylase n=1 Tax=Hyalangium minutum TaxID=394096 RepID=A0A085WWD6_9BACT|nr:beta-ketoacyl synthase N-terminal-like domain-containing protein [Hyalangium minutum]KFE71999.1 Malonyl CoA-acyl carrier protein transacylase [Hyalangium minutum]
MTRPRGTDGAIAIVGLACRFPSAPDQHAFWANLLNETDLIRLTPAERWYWSTVRSIESENGSQPGSYLDDVDRFDAPFFHITGREAGWMDPHHRIMLELAWACLEDAAHTPSSLRGKAVGVYVGASSQDWRPLLEASSSPAEGYTALGAAASFVTSRISYFFNFKGPSLAIDTACSSSLVALHRAVRDIRLGECEQALVGGVNLNLIPAPGICFSRAGMLSPRGRCRTFDEGADGYVRGEGAAMLLLKPLAQARADGDRIYGTVYGSAMNHGGAAPTVTSPNPYSQSSVIAEAFRDAGIPPDRVSYVETHGTGTPLGDPIEIAGLKRALSALAREHGVELAPGSVGLGAVKTHLGHLEAAAGIAGVVKVLLCLGHGKRVGLQGFEKPNSRLRLDGSPLFLIGKPVQWPAGDRVAGVSSFGFGGVNAHVVLGDPPAEASGPQATPGTGHRAHCLVLSAANDVTLRARCRDLLSLLEGRAPRPIGLSPHDEGGLLSLIYTLQVGREPLPARLASPVQSIADVIDVLSGWLAGKPGPLAVHGNAGAPPASPESPPRLEDAPEVWCRRWVQGTEVDWALLYPYGRPLRMGLPSYPFEDHRYWAFEQPRSWKNPVETLAERPTETAALTALYAEQERIQRQLIVQRTFLALSELGLREPISSGELATRLGVQPKYERLLTAVLDILRAAGHVEETGGAIRLVGQPAAAQPGPANAALDLLQRCLSHLSPVLRGELPATHVLFPDGAMSLVENVYRGNPIADFFNARTAEAVEKAVLARLAQLPDGGTVHLLEIGAGTGGTTAGIIDRLAPHAGRISYTYTDVSLGFRNFAERFAERASYLSWALLDIERDPAAQREVPISHYDVVIASNVLHATTDIRRTLEHVATLMTAGGVLVLNEICSASPFTTLTFGLLDGWWRFRDPEVRIPGSPGLSFDSWRQMLGQRRFQSARSVAGEGADRLGQQVITSVCTASKTSPKPTATATATPVRAPAPGGTAETRETPEVEEALSAALAATLRIDRERISPQHTLYELGVDSLVALDLRNALEVRFSVKIPMDVPLEELTIQQAAGRLTELISLGVPAETAAADEGEDGYV